MSVDTRVLIAGKVSVEAVVEALKTELGVVATDNTRGKQATISKMTSSI